MEQERKFKKLKLVSDGTSFGTRLLDGDGNPIDCVSELTFTVKGWESLATLQVTLIDVECELVGVVKEQYSKITFTPSKDYKQGYETNSAAVVVE